MDGVGFEMSGRTSVPKWHPSYPTATPEVNLNFNYNVLYVHLAPNATSKWILYLDEQKKKKKKEH